MLNMHVMNDHLAASKQRFEAVYLRPHDNMIAPDIYCDCDSENISMIMIRNIWLVV